MYLFAAWWTPYGAVAALSASPAPLYKTLHLLTYLIRLETLSKMRQFWLSVGLPTYLPYLCSTCDYVLYKFTIDIDIACLILHVWALRPRPMWFPLLPEKPIETFFRLLHDKLIIMLRSRNIPVSLLKCEMRVKCSVKLFQWPETTWPGSWTTVHSVCLVNFFGTIRPTHSDSRGVPASVLSQHRTKLTWWLNEARKQSWCRRN